MEKKTGENGEPVNELNGNYGNVYNDKLGYRLHCSLGMRPITEYEKAARKVPKQIREKFSPRDTRHAMVYNKRIEYRLICL